MKSIRQLSSKRILNIAPDSFVETTRRLLLANAGFQVESARTAEAARRLLNDHAFSVVIFGAQLNTADAESLAGLVREVNPHTRLIATGRQQMRHLVDGYLEAQESPDVFLRLVGSLLMQAHGHPDVSGDYVVYADAERRYISVSDGFCHLLGYSREELLSMNIDQVTFPESANVPAQFREFLSSGRQAGRFLLQHRDRSPVAVSFEAQVLEDGCMVSVLTPVDVSSSVAIRRLA